jgi:putative transcriptional regulator
MQNKVPLIRRQKEMTQQQLADAVGVSRQTIISIEKGDCVPSLLLAFKLANFFKKPIEELFDSTVKGGDRLCIEEV